MNKIANCVECSIGDAFIVFWARDEEVEENDASRKDGMGMWYSKRGRRYSGGCGDTSQRIYNEEWVGLGGLCIISNNNSTACKPGFLRYYLSNNPSLDYPVLSAAITATARELGFLRYYLYQQHLCLVVSKDLLPNTLLSFFLSL